MDFEFSGTFYVEKYYLEDMVEMCRKGANPHQAFGKVTAGWDDCDYYLADYIEDEVVKEIKRRLREEN